VEKKISSSGPNGQATLRKKPGCFCVRKWKRKDRENAAGKTCPHGDHHSRRCPQGKRGGSRNFYVGKAPAEVEGLKKKGEKSEDAHHRTVQTDRAAKGRSDVEKADLSRKEGKVGGGGKSDTEVFESKLLRLH